MEILKRKENYKDPVRTAKRNFIALGILYLIVSWVIYTKSGIEVSGMFIGAAIMMFIIGVLIGKRKMLGVYLGWLFVILASVSSVINGVFLALLIFGYVGYWNYKAHIALKGSVSSAIIN